MVADQPECGKEPDDRISSLVSEYFERRQAGEGLTPEGFAAEHPEMAGELQPYLAGLALVEQARLLSGVGGVQSQSPAATLPTITGFQLLEEIGRGGMGVAYRAVQLSTKRVVALKVMLAGPFASAASRRRFDREVELAARLQHPGIVRVLESGEAAGQRYYAMDYVAGVRLDRHVAASRPDVRATLSLFTQICEAVEYAHRHGVVHRDLKPGNVLIDAEGGAHILDFGLAKAVDQADPEEVVTSCLSMPGQILGTLFYLSPEQAIGESRGVDHRADVYSLGVMLFETLTGSLPFEAAGSPSQVMRRIAEEQPKPPSTLSKQVKPELETIILKALAKEKSHRYQSVAELAEDLRRYLAGEPILARRPSSLYVLRKKMVKHRLAVGLSVGAIVLAGLGAGGAWWARQREWSRARAQAVMTQRFLEVYGSAQALGQAQSEYIRYPDLPEAGLAWAQAQYAGPETRSHAVRFLEGELHRQPSCWFYRLLLAEIYRRAGETDRADALQTQADREAPDTAEGWYLRSYAVLDRAQAARCATEAVLRQADHALAWDRLSYLRLQIGDLAGAREAAERMILLEGITSNWMIFRGNVLAREGRLEEAVQEYSSVAVLQPNDPSPYRARAHVYRRLKRYAESVTDYTQALKLEGEATANVWDHYQRAAPLWILGRRVEAAEDYRRVRVLLGRPSNADARRFVVLHEEGQTEEAARVLQAALRDVPDEWGRQVFRCLDGQLPPGEFVAEVRSRDVKKQLCEACYYAGEACRLAGRPDEARRWFQECVSTGVEYDLESGNPTPMNEYELARWRLETLAAEVDSASPPENP